MSFHPLARGGSELTPAWACRARSQTRGVVNLEGGNRALERQLMRCTVVLLMALSGSAVACGDDSAGPTLPTAGLRIDSISPASVAAGSPDLTLIVMGSGFRGGNFLGSRAVWSVKDSVTNLATTFVSSTELSVVVPATLLSDTVVAHVYLLSRDLSEDARLQFSNAVPFTVTPTSPDETTVAEVVISQPPTSIGVGETALLHAWANASRVGRIRPENPIVWRSTDTTIAVVAPSASADGYPGVDFHAVLHGVEKGTVTISAATGGKRADLTIAVGEPAKYMVIFPRDTILHANLCESTYLTIVPQDASGNLLPGRNAIWTSSNDRAAMVEAETGLVFSRDSGTATITATTGLVSAKATITVTGRFPGRFACDE